MKAAKAGGERERKKKNENNVVVMFIELLIQRITPSLDHAIHQHVPVNVGAIAELTASPTSRSLK
jgi:hypothetical protein